MARYEREKGKPSSGRGGSGVPVQDLPERAVDDALAALMGWVSKSEKRRSLSQKRMLLRNHLANGDRWSEWLADLPSLGLMALEALVEVGGASQLEDIEILVAERSGEPLTAAHLATELLIDRMLVIPLKAPESDTLDGIVVYADALPVLEARVRGISLPALPESLRRSDGSVATDVELNRTLAIAGLTAHRRLRFTNAGAPDRTTLKRFAKGLGVESEEVFRLVEAAIARGYVGARDENLLPHALRMLDGVPTSQRDRDLPPAIRTVLGSWLEEGTWISREALLRACVRGFLDRQGRSSRTANGFLLTEDITGIFDLFGDAFAQVDTLEHHRADGTDWLRPASQPTERRGDGHVTTNFEVMLGPAAHPQVVAEVALGCELQRVDRVLTFRITPESVGRGRAAGLAPGQLTDALASVGRHPVPANVAQLVGEWEQASRVARVARGWFLFIDRELQPALQKGKLAAHLIGSPTEGVLELDPQTPRELIDAALAEHGVDASLLYPMSEALHQRDSPGLEVAQSPFDDDWLDDEHWLEVGARPWSLEPAGDEGLRARIEAARARGFEDDLREALPSEELERPPAELVAQLEGLAGALSALEGQASRELNRFARKIVPREREALRAMRSTGFQIAPFLALKPKWRRRIVRDADSVEELIVLSTAAAGEGRCTHDGAELLAALYALDTEPDAPLRTAWGGPADGAAESSPALDEALTTPVRLPRALRGKGKGRAEPDVIVRFDGDSTSAVSSARGKWIPAKPTRAKPRIEDFPELDAAELFRLIAHAAASRRSIACLIESDSVRSVAELRIERIEIQSGRQVVLAKDLQTLERRTVPVRQIVSLRS